MLHLATNPNAVFRQSEEAGEVLYPEPVFSAFVGFAF